MTDASQTEAWGTSHRYDPVGVAPETPPDDGRHALPVEPVEAAPATSYGTFFEHPPYSTEQAPMTVEVPPETVHFPRPMPTPSPVADTGVAGVPEQVTCPECGATQNVNLNRRDASDFCRRCDFPLFWTPARVTRDWSPDTSGESLRRLPGTGGSARLASTACPHCAELNFATAQTCVRCGQSMRITLPPPPAPAPYIPPPPPPLPDPEPEHGVPWWVWTLLGTVLVAAVLVVLYVTGVFD